MDPAVLDRAAGGHQGLAGHLAPEDPLALLVGAGRPRKMFTSIGSRSSRSDQEVEGLAHRPILAGPPAAGETPSPPSTVPAMIRSKLCHHARIVFPEGFVWGTATSAHQIEGGNVNNDWWAFEHDPASGCVESSGDGCDSWHRWDEDVALVADLGLGAYRFSLEWSRIEPAEGEFSSPPWTTTAGCAAACQERGIQPVVTFHHFTTPCWLAARGGWEAPDAPDASPASSSGPPPTWAT